MGRIHCPECGSVVFTAEQTVTGKIAVQVALDENQKAVFLSNPTPDGNVDTSGLNFSEPEPPFACSECGHVMEGVDGTY